jgi:hypothetical protein
MGQFHISRMPIAMLGWQSQLRRTCRRSADKPAQTSEAQDNEETMENLVTPGRVFFAIAIGFFGGQYLIYASGAGGPAPGPPWTPGRPLWAYVAGAALLVSGVASRPERWRV